MPPCVVPVGLPRFCGILRVRRPTGTSTVGGGLTKVRALGSAFSLLDFSNRAKPEKQSVRLGAHSSLSGADGPLEVVQSVLWTDSNCRDQKIGTNEERGGI